MVKFYIYSDWLANPVLPLSGLYHVWETRLNKNAFVIPQLPVYD